MARLSPISRGEANAGIAACRADPGHYILSYGDWTACCVGDTPGKVVCIVCDKDENCSTYEEFRGFRELHGLLEVSPGLQLVKREDTSEPRGSDKPVSGT